MARTPYEVLIRMKPNGTVAGASIRYVTVVDGRSYESDPEPLSGTDDASFTAFASQFSASAVAERDTLAASNVTLTQHVAALTTEKAAVQAELDALKASLIPGPRQITPGQLLERISPELMVKIWNSGLPIAGIACATLFTWQGFIDLDSERLTAILKSLEDASLLSADDVAKIKE